MWQKLASYNTLRNQMLFGFLLAMVLILCVVGIVTFSSLSKLLRSNAEMHIQQTAVQANGRMEAVLDQVDALMTQVATTPYVQKVLNNEWGGVHTTFSQRQALQPSVNVVQTYTSGVYSVELYSDNHQRLYPLDDESLDSRIGREWITKAREARGRVVWIGMDPSDPEHVIALRTVNLMDHWFAPGGYLLVRMDRTMFDIGAPVSNGDGRESLLIVGTDKSLIRTNDSRITNDNLQKLLETPGPTVYIGTEPYIQVRQESELTGWTLVILTPMNTVTKGISILRTAIFVSAGIGTVLSILIAILLSTFITRPILRLIKTMRSARLGVLKPAEGITSTMEINELNHTYNQLVEHMNELIRLVYEKETLQSRTELKALQAQIHPHFLFNTLEALYWSLQEKDEEELADFVLAMSDLFRYTISRPNKDEWVTLREELDHVERYLLIMKLRFGTRLTWTLDAPPAYAMVKLPKLIIQPIVENAILHGVESRIGPGQVDIRVRPTADGLGVRISVQDDGRGMDREELEQLRSRLSGGTDPAARGLGVGIYNVHTRLRLFYAKGKPDEWLDYLAIWSEPDMGTRVELTIPMESEEGLI